MPRGTSALCEIFHKRCEGSFPVVPIRRQGPEFQAPRRAGDPENLRKEGRDPGGGVGLVPPILPEPAVSMNRSVCRIVGEEPFRIFFPLAVLAGIGGVAVWPLHHHGVIAVYPGFMHARLLTAALAGVPDRVSRHRFSAADRFASAERPPSSGWRCCCGLDRWRPTAAIGFPSGTSWPGWFLSWWCFCSRSAGLEQVVTRRLRDFLWRWWESSRAEPRRLRWDRGVARGWNGRDATRAARALPRVMLLPLVGISPTSFRAYSVINAAIDFRLRSLRLPGGGPIQSLPGSGACDSGILHCRGCWISRAGDGSPGIAVVGFLLWETPLFGERVN